MTELETLIRQQWVKRDGTPDESMVKYCLKEGKYIDLGDYYLRVGDAKPNIEKTMWYDDETEGPDASRFEAFREYNMRGKRLSLEDAMDYGRSEVWIFTQYTHDRTGGKLKSWLTARIGEEPTHVGEYRKATEDDIKAIKQGLAEIKADYEKRLKTYWKKYSAKVRSAGYWANR